MRSHHSKSVAHPTGGDTGALLVFWTGTQEHAGSELRMSEVFTLLPVPTGGIVVRNNIFRSGPGVRPMNSDAEIAHTFITNYYSLFDDNAGEARAAALSPIYVRRPNRRRRLSVCPSFAFSLSFAHSERSCLCRCLSVCLSARGDAVQRPDSALQFEDDARIGMEAIVEKLQSLPALRHKIVTLDFQPFNDKACVIFVNGEILIEGETNPMLFAQCFFLVAVEGAAFPFYVANDIFQFNYA